MTDVIAVTDVSVAYKFYAKPSDILREMVFGRVQHEQFWALSNVSLSVKEGERIGIVGPNGAGKSTLLKVITGNIAPTKGHIAVGGRISSLLSMVPAWNEEASGIENVRFNLLLQGIPESRIAALTEDIIEFTELGPFIYQPVKTYSTGMGARLSFGIATASEPDILIIDEVLGTGDGYFAAKAYRRMQEFCARGRALLFVSHSLAAVQQMCSRVVWLQNGSVRMAGPADRVLAQYELDYRKAEDEVMRTKHLASTAVVSRQVKAGEVGDEAIRLRVVSSDGARFPVPHYVRRIDVNNLGTGKAVELPLELPPSDQPATSKLDLLSSEWGRLHERQGKVCRILQRASGKNPGGQIIIGRDLAEADDGGRIRLSVGIESSTTDGGKPLALEVLDVERGEWRGLAPVSREKTDGDWYRQVFEGEVSLTDEEKTEQIRARLLEQNRPVAEIVELSIRTSEGASNVVKEHEPFELMARLRFLRRVPLADFSIKFSRADGTYVFWQSSGMVGANLTDAEGERTVRFRFTDNVFGAGEYFVNAYIADGWRFPENYPYAEVFDRRINALAFRIVPEKPDLDLGIVAKMFAVEVE